MQAASLRSLFVVVLVAVSGPLAGAFRDALSAREPQVLDAGRLLIRRGEEVIGSEEFSLRRGRASGGEGYTLAARASYPPRGTRVALAPVVELGPDSLPALVQFDVLGEGQRRVYARFGSRRLTIRIVRPDGEAAREYPASPRSWVADDSVFALYAIPPGRTPGEIDLVHPRTERRSTARLSDRGTERVLMGGVAHTLHHLVLETSEGPRHLWYDSSGRLMKVELPALNLEAERVEGGS